MRFNIDYKNMKRFSVICFLFFVIGFSADAQRKRTTSIFDGDIWTRPSNGFYGIGVRSGQPFLVSPTNDPIRIKVEHAYIVGVQLNANGGVEYEDSIQVGSYQGRRTEIVSLNKDSLTVTLPNPRDTINFGRNLTFNYWGFHHKSLFKYFDATYAFRFSDTVFVKQSTGGGLFTTYVFLPNTWMGSMTTTPIKIKETIKPGVSFVLSQGDRRWYLHFNGIDY